MSPPLALRLEDRLHEPVNEFTIYLPPQRVAEVAPGRP
jgi:hypothetical protein